MTKSGYTVVTASKQELGWKCRHLVRDFSPQNDRHADMPALCRRHDTDHVGNIAPCWLVGRRVGVVAHVGRKLL